MMPPFFVYRDLLVTGWRRGDDLAFPCPVCGKCGRLDRWRFFISCFGAVTVFRRLLCPKPECGWDVQITGGIAEDVGELDFGLKASPEKPSPRGQPLLWKRRPRKPEPISAAG